MVDNDATHKHPTVVTSLVRNPRVTLHFAARTSGVVLALLMAQRPGDQ